ncbi:MAG: hypothetical protein Q9210_000516 [Variospora velana]
MQKASGSSRTHSQASLIPVDCSPAHSLLTSKPSVVVLIQSIPAYTPTARPYESTFQHAAAATNPPPEHHHCSIIRRFSNQDGGIAFTLQSRGEGDIPGHEIEVDLRNIYDYVSPAELERYENLDWERDDERRRNRPKVGRPRKMALSGTTLTISHNKPKRPLGRPRKYPVVTKTQGPADFAGVHIPTPVKPRLAPQGPSPRRSPAAQQPDQVGFQRSISTTSAVESTSTSESDGIPLNIDQVTPSNARKVVAARPPEPSPSKNSRRTTYSMVEASLGRCDMSDEEDVMPDSGSEDELSIIPAPEARFASKTEISNSTPGVDEQHESLHLSGPESSDNQAVTQPNDKTRKVHSVHDGLSSSNGVVDTDEPSDLLQQFQARKARRIKSKSSNTTTSDISKSKPIYEYFQPKDSVKDVVAYPSLFKGHQPVPTSPTWQGLAGKAPSQRTHLEQDLTSRNHLANDHTNDDLITLGSPLTPSDASSVHDRDHLAAIDLRPPRSLAPDITLGDPLTSSSEDNSTKPLSSSSMFTHVQNTNTNHRTKRRRSSGGSGNEGARYDRLVRR